MGHYCRICGRIRPNERFSGHGHRIHICRKCANLPKPIRDAILQRQELELFMRQSHISKKNVARLKVLAASDNPETAALAQIVLEVAQVTPHKRRRFKVLKKEHPELLQTLVETDLIVSDYFFYGQWPEEEPESRDTYEAEVFIETCEPPLEEYLENWDTYEIGGFSKTYEPPPAGEPGDADVEEYEAELFSGRCEPPPEEDPEDWDIAGPETDFPDPPF